MPDLIPPGIGPLTQTAGTSLAADPSTASWLGSTWYQQLQPGSWRGVGFVMDAAENKAGRRTAIHEYPYRDTVWVEDLGRLPRRFSFQAFQVGDDVYQQRDAMIEACEQAGAGTLVHPTLGSVQCVLVDFSTTDRRERGRVVELAFSFVVSGDILFPTTALATGANVDNLAGALNQASAADLASIMGSASFIPQMASRSIPAYGGLAIAGVNDPTRALNSVSGLQGYYGRYSTGRRGVLQPPSATVQSCLSDSIASRQAVLEAVDGLNTAAGGICVSELRFARSTEFSDAAAAVAQALLAATSDPADAIRLLLPLTQWVPAPLPGSGPLWSTARAIQDALTSNVRCAACAALAQACALYRPISYQDAQSIRLLVCGVLDDEATRCADQGRDASYQALRDLRAAVALDLAVRGATLPVLVEVTTLVSMPSLAEAWTLYQDPTREPELVASANAPHPLFLPLEFPALAK